jgi:hypothetical protein
VKVNDKDVSFALLMIMVVGIVWGLSGCSTPTATKGGMVLDPVPALQKHPYSVALRTQGGIEAGTTDFPGIPNDDFSKAIEESIIKSGLFTKVIQINGADYSMDVSIISMSKPLIGTSFTVNLETGWSLVNTASKEVVMRESIKSSHTATMGDAFVGVTRFRLAVEGAARENIRLGLLSISKLQLK